MHGNQRRMSKRVVWLRRAWESKEEGLESSIAEESLDG